MGLRMQNRNSIRGALGKGVVAIVASLGLIALVFMLGPSGPRPINPSSPRARRLYCIASIRSALIDYYHDHNKTLPVALSGLVPDYLPATNTWILFGPQECIKQAFREGATSPQADARTAYVYLGRNTRSVATPILYEKPGIWIHDLSSSTHPNLYVLLPDFSIQPFPVDKLTTIESPHK
jgi:hypothetical protein